MILITTPKGGSGKTTAARLLASEAAREMDVRGIDCDPQRTFARWGERRQAARAIEREIAPLEVDSWGLRDWRAIERALPSRRLTVIDTPPSVEDHIQALDGLRRAASLIVVPCGCTQDDVDSIGPWAEAMSQRGGRVVVVLNRADRRRRSFAHARDQLVQVAAVSPVEIPMAEEMHGPFGSGLAPVDFGTRSAAGAASAALWGFVKREIAR